MQYFIELLYLISTVSSLSSKINKQLELNQRRRSEQQDPPSWYPIQGYGRGGSVFRLSDGTSESEDNENDDKEDSTPSEGHYKREEDGTRQKENKKIPILRSKMKEVKRKRHHRWKYVGRPPKLLNTSHINKRTRTANRIRNKKHKNYKSRNPIQHKRSHFKNSFLPYNRQLNRTYIVNRHMSKQTKVQILHERFNYASQHFRAQKVKDSKRKSKPTTREAQTTDTDFIRTIKTTTKRILISEEDDWIQDSTLQQTQQQVHDNLYEEEENTEKKKKDEALYIQKGLFKNSKHKPKDMNIFNEAHNIWQPWMHRVRDNTKVNLFINQSLKHYLRLIHAIKLKTKDSKWKKKLKRLGKAYENKFNEFITDTNRHKIKSRMGTERVILNSIDVSNRILKRLIHFMLADMDKKGSLRKIHTLNIILKELKDETNSQRQRACSKFDICRSRNDFTDFANDILNILLNLDNKKFEKAYNSLTEAFINIDFSKTLGHRTDETIKEYFKEFRNAHPRYKKPGIMVIKNIISNRNSPLVVYGDSDVTQVDKTIALLEIFNMLDQEAADNESNIKQRQRIRTHLDNFARGKEKDIKTMMLLLVVHIKNVINQIKGKPWVDILKSIDILFN